MNLSDLVNHAISKERFQTVEDYIEFSTRYLEYITTALQARIVSRNEHHYEFFQYSRLTETSLPHIAIFLNDVQRKRTKQETEYGINATFLPGHFKAYTIKLNPLDGVYYCDIRPNMVHDVFLSQYIKTIDHFLYADIWRLLNQQGQPLKDVTIDEDDEADIE